MLRRPPPLNVKALAVCRCCLRPLPCIYDQNLRDFCWECENGQEDSPHAPAPEFLKLCKGL